MPPASNMRKSSTTTTTATEQHSAHNSLNALFQPSRRSTSGRAIRVNTTRPTNYYARPFGSLSAGADNGANMADASDTHPQGFYPGLQYFTDAITAMPKEVMKQFTLMKEVEAKIHGPNEQLGKLIDVLMLQPVPRQKIAGAGTAAGQGLLSFTAHNSISGSTNASVVNGVAGRPDAQASVNGSVDGEEHADSQEEIARRMQYVELCKGLKSLIPNLDEKHGVLEEANRVLALQELRIDTVMPHVEGELSEEARLGSMTHWAYADNRQKRQVVSTANRRDVASTNTLAAAASLVHEHDISNARRDAGKEAMREKTKGKRVEHPGDSDFDDKPKKQKSSKGRATASAAFLANLGGPSSSAAVTNGEPVTKRKKPAEKGAGAVGMERTASASGRTPKIPRDIPRSMPVTDQTVKKAPRAKQAPSQPSAKRKAPGSVQASPMLASSPLASSFVPIVAEAPPMSRPQSSRLRHNNVATTNLRHEQTHNEETTQQPLLITEKIANATRPVDDVDHTSTPKAKENPSVTGTLVMDAVSNINESRNILGITIDVPPSETVEPGANDVLEKPAVKRNPPESIRQSMEQPTKEQMITNQPDETLNKFKLEDTEMPDIIPDSRPTGSQSGITSHKSSGRGSAVGTPRTESFPALDGSAMLRTRSTRSKPNARGEDRDSSSTEPGPNEARKHQHRRVASNSHLVKQLAPFNRSPDLDRHRSRDDMDEDLDSNEEKPSEVEEPKVNDIEKETEPDLERSARRASARRPISRRNTGPLRATPPGRSRASTPEDIGPAKSPSIAPPSTRQQRSTQASFHRAVQPPPPPPPPPPAAADDEDEDDSEHDPDDPNEPKYCYCNRGSYGEMVACDNDECPREWFHLGCTELREAPGEEEVWYCRECRPKFARKVKGRSVRGG